MQISRQNSTLDPSNSQNFYEQTKSKLTTFFRRVCPLDDSQVNNFEARKISVKPVFNDDAYEGVASSCNDVFSSLYKH